jgi:hypothetical protein
MILIVIVAISLFTLLLLQQNHYEFLRSEKEQKSVSLLTEEIEAKLKEFDDVKKRVDALVVRAGFKL